MKVESVEPVWFITGASSGFGAALARAAMDAGYRVIATARDMNSLDLPDDRVLRLEVDVTEAGTITRGVGAALAHWGQIDVLVNNAGFGVFGAVEELSEDELRRQIDTNFLGQFRMIKAVLPAMRRVRRGHIFNFSSVGGVVSFAGAGAYSASKFAVEGMSAALAQELEPLGLHVTVVEPGAFRTAFNKAESRHFAAAEIADYKDTAGAMRHGVEDRVGHEPGDPARAAAAILSVAREADPPRHLVLGTDAARRVHDEMTARLAELDRWSHLTSSTDFT